ncbi:hypothetical protein GCM10023189_39030 [Nibrella saemangeumensis]|uniref:AAA+ ATPase domain-containing protein n=2 Tax=Nibrella saemangeumensis TaxID=1084526 RepID=A0ABP8N705_9BACT
MTHETRQKPKQVTSNPKLTEINLWSKYIKAQKKVLESLSKPIGILYSDLINEGTLRVTVKPNDDKAEIQNTLINRLGVKPQNIHFDDSYFIIPNDIQIKNEVIDEVNTKLSNNYCRVIPRPEIDGVFKSTRDSLNKLLEELLPDEPDIESRFSQDSAIFLSFEEITRLDDLLKKYPNLSRDKRIGCIYSYSVNPIASHIQSFYKPLINVESKFTIVNEKSLEFKLRSNKVKISNGSLHGEVEQELKDLIRLTRLNFTISITDNISGETSLRTFYDKNINNVGSNGDEFEESKGSLDNSDFDNADESFAFWYKYILNDKVRGKYTLKVENSTYEYDIKQSIEHWHSLSNASNELIYRYLNRTLETTSKENDFQFYPDERRIAFDILNSNDLLKKLQRIINIPNLLLNHRGKDQRYKVRLKYESPLKQLEELINKYLPNAEYIFDTHKDRLRLFITRNNSKIWSIINEKLFSDNWYFELSTTAALYQTYGLLYDAEQRKADDIRLYRSLTGCEVGISKKEIIGQVRRVEYPSLDIELGQGINLSQEIDFIIPVFTGEYERIYRLNEVLEVIQQRPSSHPNNYKVAKYLFDSSKAKSIPETINLSVDGDEWQKMAEHLSSKTINRSQFEAILKAIHAPELALIQGPPGTGKSTAIAELVWQLVRTKPDELILLTSEAHLAVDNAMEKLSNSNHNLVKPIRFGNEEKLETEGARYSYDRLSSWTRGQSLEEESRVDELEDNILVRWHQNIINRCLSQVDEETRELRSQWAKVFNTDNDYIRKILFDQYIEHTNVIGATTGSIGWRNSEGRPTSFLRNWDEVYPGTLRQRENPIKFDTVIIDEASKATPPELALPMLYAKKAIVVGDHRQLPPMLDEGEFAEVLDKIGENELAQFFRKQDNRVSLFEKLFLNPKLSPSLRGTFNQQYRMHPAINDVIRQFYLEDGGLYCGLDLNLVDSPDLYEPQSRYHGLSQEGFLSEDTHCIWVNVTTPEVKERTSRSNVGEVKVIKKILQRIASSKGYKDYMDFWDQPKYKPEEREIGIISFYGSQLGHLRQISNEVSQELQNIQIRLSTVDRFQGMERNIVIVSLVRSDRIASSIHHAPDWEEYPELGYSSQNDLGFAEFPNRLNVALSRAKRLLVIVGNSNLFTRKLIYKNVFQTIKNSKYGKVINADEL